MSNKNLTIRNSTAEFLIFTTANGQDTIEVKVENETYELEENSVIRKFLITASDGKNYNTKRYSFSQILLGCFLFIFLGFKLLLDCSFLTTPTCTIFSTIFMKQIIKHTPQTDTKDSFKIE